MHRLDARSKIILLLIYSIALFFCDRWIGMFLYLGVFILALALSKLPVRKILFLSIPIYVIVAIAVMGNGFVFVGEGSDVVSGEGLHQLIGGLWFSEVGFLRGIFYGIRILLLVWMSLIFCFSTTQEAITGALSWFLIPLSKIKVPTDDIAMIASIALRFIPLTAAEFFQIRDAQWARGRVFDEGSLIARIGTYGSLFVPLFVNLFRRADILSRAMDSRLYGMPGHPRTLLIDGSMGIASACVLCLGSAAFISIAILL